jgi:16S rRNA C967 or C1407 C5-methylase (RsmB/RsmF family)
VCDEPLRAPTRLPWYPDGLGWSVSTPRTMMRRDSTLAPFHKWLVRMNELGAVNRQEAVSMVPPLLIDLRPGQSVVDLCAAPGSKTAQLLEALAASPADEHALSGSGLIVANDADIKRCWMLAHQLKRFAAPNLMVTQHDAQSFPSVTGFDRVLCDVPCTGDGTLRKAPDIWRKWTPQLGNGIHRLQKNILRRGVELLKPGGRLVYSTCSMNPVENEAVVADALRHFGPDVLQLVDVSDQLPLLKRRPGLRTWRVKDTKLTAEDGEPASDDIRAVAAGADVGETAVEGSTAITVANGWFDRHEQVPPKRTRVVSTLFAPSQEELDSGNFPLDRCVRLVPIDQDTGAFFVAVLVKAETAACAADATGKVDVKDAANVAASVASAPSNAGSASGAGAASAPANPTGGEGPAADEGADNALAAGAKPAAPGKPKGGRVSKQPQHSRLITDDPLVGVDRVSEADVVRLAEFFGLDETSCRACLMTRNSEAEKYKKVLVVTPGIRALLTRSIGSAEGEEAGLRGRLRVVNAGVRLFERTTRRDADPPFRVLSDGMHVLRSSMRRRLVTVGWSDLRLVMGQESTSIDALTPAARAQLGGLSTGSVIAVAGEGAGEEIVCLWKGKHMITKLMPGDELTAIRTRHGLEPEQKQAAVARAAPAGDGAADAGSAAPGPTGDPPAPGRAQ